LLNEAERKTALSMVRRAVETAIREGGHPQPQPHLPILSCPSAAFVTLSRGGQLRGCIGVLEPTRPLAETLLHCAVAAATQDRRFPPVAVAELPELQYEISILSGLQEVRSPEEIEVGRHGILIEAEGLRGLLLPQVAVDQRWDRDTFLDQVSLKAGLPVGAWKSGAQLWTFTAEVFSEEGS